MNDSTMAKVRRMAGKEGGLFALCFKMLITFLCSVVWNPMAFFANFLRVVADLVRRPQAGVPLPGSYLYAVNSLFWLVTANNILRHGVTGLSPTVGDGRFSLRTWWFNTPLSLLAFRQWGVLGSALTIALSASAFPLFDTAVPYGGYGATFWYFAASITFSMAFVVGRYHAFAWLGVPFLFLALSSGLPMVAAALFACIALLSSSVTFVVAGVVAAHALYFGAATELAVLAPGAVIAAAYALYVTGVSRQGLGRIVEILRFIGTVSTPRVRYRRRNMGRLSLTALWYGAAGAFYLVVASLTFDAVPIMTLAALALMVLNDVKIRFADTQTPEFLLLICALTEMLLYGQEALALAAPFFMVSLPALQKTGAAAATERLPVHRPWRLRELTDDAVAFLGEVPSGHRVLVTFSDPQGDYSEIFNGYRHALELMIYAGDENGLNVFPNWPMIAKYNTVDQAASMWAETLDEIPTVARQWGAHFALINERHYEGDAAAVGRPLGRFTFPSDAFEEFTAKAFRCPDWVLVHLYDQADASATSR